MEIENLLSHPKVQQYINEEQWRKLYYRVSSILVNNNVLDEDASVLVGKLTQLLYNIGKDPLKGNNGLVELPYSIFWDVKGLKEIDLQKLNVQNFDPAGWQFTGSDVERIIIANSVRVIPEGFCYGCKKLEFIELPSTCNIISSIAFAECPQLTRILYHGSATDFKTFANIADDAFQGNKQKIKIICNDIDFIIN